MSGDSLVRVTTEPYDIFVECNEDYLRIEKLKPLFFCINNNYNENEGVYKMLQR